MSSAKCMSDVGHFLFSSLNGFQFWNVYKHTYVTLSVARHSHGNSGYGHLPHRRCQWHLLSYLQIFHLRTGEITVSYSMYILIGIQGYLSRYTSILKVTVCMWPLSLTYVNRRYIYDAIFIRKYLANKTETRLLDMTVNVYIWHP